MIDHIGLVVSSLEESINFFKQALAPLGYAVLVDVPKEITGSKRFVGFGIPPKPSFWISAGILNSSYD